MDIKIKQTIHLSHDIIETSKSIKNVLLKNKKESGAHTFYFCSPTPKEGTSSVVMSFAFTIAKYSAYKVLLVDCANNQRLTNYFQNRIDYKEKPFKEFKLGYTGFENLYIAVSNDIGQTSEQFDFLIKLLRMPRNAFDILLIDGPPLKHVSDLSALNPLIDGIIMVIESEKNKGQVIIEIKKKIELSGNKILGVIINKKKKRIPKLLYQLC